ncbi:Cytochrome c oxidase subunit 5B, mitochondrial [Teratosphaeriaceae sp. CCFEE 6253]|nr:Cytochrome c oxidase subunit 5B, mitochondrial [Teratosphaeriaceae sp. CCFEE 6253]KAK3112618.1 Cytochrome c oxidase subunit 5B, mitochondrial [Teratosphaeriaceae sp. CCFEE 6253]
MIRGTSLLRTSALATTTARLSATVPRPFLLPAVLQQCRAAHAISNPTLANIEKRWEAMPPQEQADLWMALRDRMKEDWTALTVQEKKAAYWIAFGPHGPRALPPPGENWKIFRLTMYAIGVSGVLFSLVKYFSRGPPRTMTKEYQEATNEYMKENRIEPITGPGDPRNNVSMVQSGPDKMTGSEKS